MTRRHRHPLKSALLFTLCAGMFSAVVPQLSQAQCSAPSEPASAGPAAFRPQGLERAAADAWLAGADGAVLLAELRAADPASCIDVIYRRAVDLLASGTAAPVRQRTGYPLIKLVAKGRPVSSYTPYFTTTHQLLAAKLAKGTVADYFGLPVASGAAVYDVYRISPRGSVTIFVSTVAPTVELDGEIRHPGGAIQSIVPDRGKWSAPELIGEIND